MTAPNHALTGAFIGLTVHEPLLAAPLAFASHFACDAIPHYDVPEKGHVSRRFIREQLVLGGILCVALVTMLAIARPHYWFIAAVCAFLAASPDLFWIPRFLHEVRTGKDQRPRSWFLRFHAWVQWKTGPAMWWTEVLWFFTLSTFVVVHTRLP